MKKRDNQKSSLTFVASELLPSSLAVARPVGKRWAPLAGGALGPEGVIPSDDLDLQHPVREVDRVEGELKARAPTRRREVRVHPRLLEPISYARPHASRHLWSLKYSRLRGHWQDRRRPQLNLARLRKGNRDTGARASEVWPCGVAWGGDEQEHERRRRGGVASWYREIWGCLHGKKKGQLNKTE